MPPCESPVFMGVFYSILRHKEAGRMSRMCCLSLSLVIALLMLSLFEALAQNHSMSATAQSYLEHAIDDVNVPRLSVMVRLPQSA